MQSNDWRNTVFQIHDKIEWNCCVGGHSINHTHILLHAVNAKKTLNITFPGRLIKDLLVLDSWSIESHHRINSLIYTLQWTDMAPREFPCPVSPGRGCRLTAALYCTGYVGGPMGDGLFAEVRGVCLVVWYVKCGAPALERTHPFIPAHTDSKYIVLCLSLGF